MAANAIDTRVRRRLALVGVLTLSLGLTVALSTGAEAKKKGAKSKAFAGQIAPNAGIPDAVPDVISTPLTSTVSVGKKFKGKVVGDLNVTGIQTSGSAAGAANDLTAYLTAPNGRTVDLFQTIGNVSRNLGPLTIDDDTKTSICNVPAAPTPCPDPTQTLYAPFAGTANTVYNSQGTYPTSGPLATFDGVGMKGTWTLTVFDLGAPGPNNGINVLNKWGLRITPAKPVTG